MGGEDLGGCPVPQAPSRLIIQVAGELGEIAL
jgi:hypothetical protein